MLDAVFDAESLKEGNEVSEVFDEVVVAFVGFDVAQEDYVVGAMRFKWWIGEDQRKIQPLLKLHNSRMTVSLFEPHCVVGEILRAVGLRHDDKCSRECRVVRGVSAEDAVPKLSMRYFSTSARAFRIHWSVVWGLLCHRFNLFFFAVSLVAEESFHVGEELIEVVGCFAVSLDGSATAYRALPDMRFKLTREYFVFHRFEFWVCELSSLIFSSRRCFWSRARAVSWTRSS